MKKAVIGILAHVDAGKTTLSEAMLYESGSIREMGRVDNKDAFLDTYSLERKRGITIFSKQAMFIFQDMQITLLDTPGHVDFSAEMERALSVLDYAILVISGADGVQGHTQTLWRLLKTYQIPVFLFINKMDQRGTDKTEILEELQTRLNEGCTDFSETKSELFFEKIAINDENTLNTFLEFNKLETDQIKRLISDRNIFPCFFGSALRLDGVREFLQGIETFTSDVSYLGEFGAKVFKIVRDEQGNRLTYMKITGGRLRVKMVLDEEKVNQIRLYSGEKYNTLESVEAGTVCAVTGLNETYPGQGLGIEVESTLPILEPVLTYQVQLPPECDAAILLPKLRQLEEEEPELHIVWNETLKEIQVKIMGEVQTEILKSLIAERFGIEVEFGNGNIVYKETITNRVEGVGHFEPLRHYAEVHLLLEPEEPGSGLVFATTCSEDMLGSNWQRLILTHLREKEHKGVLTGADITDMKITLVAGRAHQKHTEGGDFRQATYRAVRQGLKEAESVLLEPYYEFRLEVPDKMIGRAMIDIEKIHGRFEMPQTKGEMTILTGCAPVATMRDYQKEVIAYSKGHGRLFCTLKGYEPCHNTEEIMTAVGYDSERDVENPTGSVFCAHGAGFSVSWENVKEHMHVEGQFSAFKEEETEYTIRREKQGISEEVWMDTEEVDKIIERTYYSNKREKSTDVKGFPHVKSNTVSSAIVRKPKKAEVKEGFLLVDGYNIIFAWNDLSELAKVSMDGARGKLLDTLSNYQGIRKCNLIVVFDAYRVEGHATEVLDYQNIYVVYTKEAETADQYIERFAYENGKKYDITVATSDGMEQIIIRGQGCKLISARELEQEIESANKQICEEYAEKQPRDKNYVFDSLLEKVSEQIGD